MSKQSIKETMQQSLEAIEQYPAMDLDNIKPSRLLAYNLRQAIEEYTSCEQDVGLLKIVLEQKAAQLKSCEIALAERDASIEDYEQAEEQEPDFWLGYGLQAHTEKPSNEATPLYTHPAPQYKKLTDSDILEIAEQQATVYCELEQEPFIFDGMDIAAFARAIEARVLGCE